MNETTIRIIEKLPYVAFAGLIIILIILSVSPHHIEKTNCFDRYGQKINELTCDRDVIENEKVLIPLVVFFAMLFLIVLITAPLRALRLFETDKTPQKKRKRK